jgi:L-threonylcarbamoyladenylate synthase
MKTEVLQISDDLCLPRAFEILQAGGLVAIPTDTVYGIAGLAFENQSILDLYRVKNRSTTLPIPVMIATVGDLTGVAKNIPIYGRRLAERFWPGPITLVFSGADRLPKAISQTGTVGVRMPDHWFVLSLIQKVGPLAVTSANLSGRSEARSAVEVLQDLGGKIDLLIDGGKMGKLIASTVVDCTEDQPMVLREGPISISQIMTELER